MRERYETPYTGPLELFDPYDPKREIGQATGAACPEHPWWWLVAAAVAGLWVGVAATKPNKRRRGRIG